MMLRFHQHTVENNTRSYIHGAPSGIQGRGRPVAVSNYCDYPPSRAAKTAADERRSQHKDAVVARTGDRSAGW